MVQKLLDPALMTVAQLEQEVGLLMAHRDRLHESPLCPLPSCDGSPHPGFPKPHRSNRVKPGSPLAQARDLDPGYRRRSHLEYLSARLTQAMIDVENGISRRIIVSMPPRMGKSQLGSVYFPLWTLARHPDWPIALISHSPFLATTWGRATRRLVEENKSRLGLELASDAGAVSGWETTKGGGIISRSAPGQSVTGLGFKVMLIDDPVKDYADAHSQLSRDAIWDWWRANAVPRLHPPSLVVVTGTRWHKDDFIGRLLSDEYEGDSSEWEEIVFPALAEENDVLGRLPGEPLISPLQDETIEEALKRWSDLKKTVGAYSWASLYQQRPSPPKGAIFNSDWWKFWTINPEHAREDGKVVFLPEEQRFRGPKWLDSWDCTFGAKDKQSGDFVVGQRWWKSGPDRFLVAQQKDRWSFTETLERMVLWADPEPHPVTNPYGNQVHERLIEAAANGVAIIEVMKKKVSGIKAINPTSGKEARARAVTPEIESGNVYLPFPGDPGNEWVYDLLEELRAFPQAPHDDQVDALTQALSGLRDAGKGSINVPRGADVSRQVPRRVVQDLSRAARSDMFGSRRGG